MNYSEQLKDPRWQRRRLEVMQASKFSCDSCGAKEKTLHVHHRGYLRGVPIWEYPSSVLDCLCDDCHERMTEFADRFALICAQLNETSLQRVMSYAWYSLEPHCVGYEGLEIFAEDDSLSIATGLMDACDFDALDLDVCALKSSDAESRCLLREKLNARRGSKVRLEQLKDLRWQQRQLEIIQKAKSTCQRCGDTKGPLAVHHVREEEGKDIWDYPDLELECLCEKCHKTAHELRDLMDLVLPYLPFDCQDAAIGYVLGLHYVVGVRSNKFPPMRGAGMLFGCADALHVTRKDMKRATKFEPKAGYIVDASLLPVNVRTRLSKKLTTGSSAAPKSDDTGPKC